MPLDEPCSYRRQILADFQNYSFTGRLGRQFATE